MTLPYLLNILRDHKIQGTFAGLSTEAIWQQFLNPTLESLGWKNLSPLAITMPTPSLRLAPTHYVALNGASSNLTQLRHRSTSHMMIDDNNLAIITDFDNWELLFRNETIAEYRAEEFLADDDRTETSVFLELKRLIGNAAVTSGAWIHTAEELWRKRVDEAEIDAWVKEFNQLRKAIGSVLIANPAELPQPKQHGRPRTAYAIMGITAKPEHRDRDEMTLNHIIQRLIDRFIIFRFAEDNNILVNGNEKPLSDLYYRALMDKPNLAKQNTVWRNISHGEKSLFAQFADAYNGGVFQSLDGHEPDSINQLPLRDDLIHQIVDTIVRRPIKKKLARLLGYIYEKYIGKRLYIIANDADAQRVAATAGLNPQQTAALRQRVASSDGPIVELANTPEKKKQAIYYTPEDVTRYINRMTVGRLIEELEQRLAAAELLADAERPHALLALFRHAQSLAVLDPACGSGAFLIEALGLFRWFYQKLARALAAPLNVDPTTDTDAEIRRRGRNSTMAPLANAIVALKSPGVFALNWNIYGVDLDPRAVEICAVSLMIQVIDELNRPATGETVRFPSIMGENIKAGNSVLCDLPAEGWRELLATNQKTVKTLVELRTTLKETHDEEQRHQLHNQIAELTAALQKKMPRTIPPPYQPFNWPAEFPEIFFGPNEGFAAVIGNPPYADIKDQFPPEMVAHRYRTTDSGDLYTLMVENMIHLASPTVGCGGMIVPMSVTFSRNMESLREEIQKSKKSWKISSFDRIPDAIFGSNVRTRASIIIFESCNRFSISLSPMRRWKSEEREFLFQTIEYFHWQGNMTSLGWPKLGSEKQATILKQLLISGNWLEGFMLKNGDENNVIFYKKTAYNWLTVTRNLPPAYDEKGNTTPQTKYGRFYASNLNEAHQLIALTTSLFSFWYWLVYGDGFDVTQSIYKELPLSPTMFSITARKELTRLGKAIQKEMEKHVDYKKNAGKKIGNYNLRHCRHLTDKVDELIVAELGLGEDFLEDIRAFCSATIRTALVVEEEEE